MTLAELHGKLSPDREGGLHERLEDLLTSDVFGTMRYLEGDSGFTSWLASALCPTDQGVKVSRLGDVMPPDKIHRIQFAFWPTLQNGREPDVALLVEMTIGPAVLVIVEAKYVSGMSNTEVPGDWGERRRTGNQIVDQIQGATDTGRDELTRWFDRSDPVSIGDMAHLLVTRDTRLPSGVYDEANRHLSAPWPILPFWLSWTTLREHLEPYRHSAHAGRSALIEDLIELLERKDLVPFCGFQVVSWVAPIRAPRFWTEEWWCISTFAPSDGAKFWMNS